MPGFSASAAPATIFIIIIQQLHFAVKQNFLIVAKNFLIVSLPPRCEIFSARGGDSRRFRRSCHIYGICLLKKTECAIIRLTAGRGLSARIELARSDKSDMEGGNATPRITCRDNESPALRITRAARRSPCRSFPALRTSRAVPGGHPRSEPRSCRCPTAARSSRVLPGRASGKAPPTALYSAERRYAFRFRIPLLPDM